MLRQLSTKSLYNIYFTIHTFTVIQDYLEFKTFWIIMTIGKYQLEEIMPQSLENHKSGKTMID